MELVDPYGRKIESPPKRPNLDLIGAVRIRDQWSSYPSVKLTPEKLAGILRDADAGHVERQMELAEEMEEKDPDLASLLQTRKLAVQGLDIEIMPASESAEDKKIAEHVKANIDDLDLDDPVLDLMDAVFRGFATLEIGWESQNGTTWVSSLNWIHQKRWTFAEIGAGFDSPIPALPKLLTLEQPLNGIEVGPFKVIYHRHKARSGFPQRAGLFRPVAFYYLFKNYDIKDWVIFLEKFGQPMRVGKFEPGASADDIKVLKEAIQNLGTDAAALISSTTLIDIIEAKTGQVSADLYSGFAEFVNKGYAKAILGQTATTEGTPGKLGGEEARSDVRHDLVIADSKALAKTLRMQLAWPMVGFNFGWDKSVPMVRFPVEEPEDLEMLSRTHGNLVNMGLPIPLGYAQKIYGIPAPQNGEEVLTPPDAPVPGQADFTVRGSGKKKACPEPRGVRVPIGSRGVTLTLRQHSGQG